LKPPVGTRFIEVALVSKKGRGVGTVSNDGKYDDLSLKAVSP
jgi:hypothetical protein